MLPVAGKPDQTGFGVLFRQVVHQLARLIGLHSESRCGSQLPSAALEVVSLASGTASASAPVVAATLHTLERSIDRARAWRLLDDGQEGDDTKPDKARASRVPVLQRLSELCLSADGAPPGIGAAPSTEPALPRRTWGRAAARNAQRGSSGTQRSTSESLPGSWAAPFSVSQVLNSSVMAS